MPVDRSRIDRMIKMIDNYLCQREQDRLNGYPDDDDDEDTDPMEFLESSRTLPVAEPPATPQEDSAPTQIHRSKDLFS